MVETVVSIKKDNFLTNLLRELQSNEPVDYKNYIRIENHSECTQ